VESVDSIVTAPARRFERRKVLGLDGYLLTGGGERETVTRNAVCFGAGHTASTPVYILNWLRNNNNVIFSDDETRYRKYNLFEEIKAVSEIDGKGYELTIPFTCDPYRYWVSPTTTNINSSQGAAGYRLNNTATAECLPRIRVGRTSASGGAGWIQWGTGSGNRIEFSNLSYPLYIDSELREIYYEDTANGNANEITTLAKFPTIAGNGYKDITFGGNVLKLTVESRERDY